MLTVLDKWGIAMFKFKKAGLIFMIACLFCGSLMAAHTQVVNSVAAIVNDDVITQAQLNQKFAMVRQQLSEAKQDMPPASVLRGQVLNQMIDDLLMLQVAKQAGVTASDAEVDNVLNNIAKRNGQSLTSMYTSLTQEGWTIPVFKQEITNEVIIQKLQQQEIASRVSISQDAVNDFIAQNLKGARSIPEYHLAQILIALPATPSSDDIDAAQAKANQVVAELNQGANFSKVAMSTSKGPHALQGGDLGWVKSGVLPSELASALKGMSIGQISKPIRLDSGFVIVKLLNKRATVVGTQSQREQVEEMLYQRQFGEDLQTFLNRLRGEAYIKIMK